MSDNLKSNNVGLDIWLIGAGPMAIDYAKVLKSLGCSFAVVGRGEDSARKFEASTGIDVIRGGLQNALINSQCPEVAIVAASMEQLSAVAKTLILNGVKRILLEKPGGLNVTEIEKLYEFNQSGHCEVFLGYNRRFYSSVQKARDIIESDGGASSFFFEFTEWSHVIKDLEKAPGVKENWFLANSTHVADLAFHLGGVPQEMVAFHSEYLPWHPSASAFSGAGITVSGIPFSFMANWKAPGRWGVEILTEKHRLILRPLEKLQVQTLRLLDVTYVDIDDSLDRQFKPGLYRQVQTFLNSDSSQLCSLSEQNAMLRFYKQIANY